MVFPGLHIKILAHLYLLYAAACLLNPYHTLTRYINLYKLDLHKHIPLHKTNQRQAFCNYNDILLYHNNENQNTNHKEFAEKVGLQKYLHRHPH